MRKDSEAKVCRHVWQIRITRRLQQFVELVGVVVVIIRNCRSKFPQFAKDADRWDRIRAEGWDHVRILNHHMAGGRAAAVRKVRDALLRAGWHPGR